MAASRTRPLEAELREAEAKVRDRASPSQDSPGPEAWPHTLASRTAALTLLASGLEHVEREQDAKSLEV